MARKVILYLLAVFLMINFSVKVHAEAVSHETIKELIVKHAMDMDMDPALALSIAKTESNYRHDRTSRYGAVGVFQLLPSTAKKMGYNPHNLHDNIKCGLAYYKYMYKIFGSTELALAAYNAGPGNVKKYRGIPPFKETKRFVSSIMTNYNNLKSNPDPAILNYKNPIHNINDFIETDDETLMDDEYRMQQDAILQSFLSNQGI